MVKLNFQVNKFYLAYLLLNQPDSLVNSSGSSFKQKIQSLRSKILKEYKNDPFYYLINLNNHDHIKWAMKQIYLNNKLSSFSTVQKIFQVIFRSPEFKTIYKETIQYKNTVKRQWDQNQDFVLKFLKEITGVKIPHLSIPVFIVHPKLRKGKASPYNQIIFGHLENWPNYSTVYVTHELLHLIFYYYKIPQNDISHVLVELISDNELRIKLNKKGTYFKEKQEYIGHSHLKKIHKKILPFWLKYLQNEQKNINSLYRKLKKEIHIK